MADVVVGIGGDISDLQRKTQAGERTITSFAGKVTGNVRAQFSALGDSIVGAFAAGAVVSQIKGTLDHFGDVQDLADRLGASAESIQKLDLMGAGSGAGAEDIVNSLTKVMRALDDVENASARGAFTKLGIDLQRMAAASPEEQLLMLADGFQRAQAKGEGFNAIYELLGKSASNLIPVLRQSREDLEKLAATPVMSDAQVARLDEIGDKLTLLSQKLTISVGGAIATFAQTIEGMGESIGTQWAYIGNLFSNLKAGDSLGVAARKAGEFRDALTEAGKAVDEVKAPKAPVVKPDQGMTPDQAKASADKIAAARGIAEELALLTAKATGNQKIIEQVEREIALRHRVADIMKRGGVDHAAALDMAKRMQDLEDKGERAANRRAGIRNKIKGATSRDSEGLWDRGNGGVPMPDKGGAFPGLDRLEALQARERVKDRDRVIGGRRVIPIGQGFDLPQNPLGEQAAQAANRNQREPMAGRMIEDLIRQLVRNTETLSQID